MGTFAKVASVLLIILCIILLSAAGVLLYQHYNSPQKKAEAEVSELSQLIKKMVVVPSKETPVLATVTDTKKLENQQFFSNAKNGDKVLIYQDARIAILFRPTERKIVNMGPMQTEKPQAVERDGQDAVREATVAYLNGTAVAGLASSIEERIIKRFPELKTATKQNAAKNSYDSTIVFAASQESVETARLIASFLGATLSDLPAGESIPLGADIVILIGNNATQP